MSAPGLVAAGYPAQTCDIVHLQWWTLILEGVDVVSEPPSDALFGADGTQLPEPLSDPMHWRGTWWETPELPAASLPPLPDTSVMREAIEAALREDPTDPVGQDPAAGLPPQPAGPVPPVAQPNEPQVPPPATPSAQAPGVQAPGVQAPRTAAPTPAPAQRGPRTGAASGRPSRPFVPGPAQSQPGRPAGWRYRPPLAGAFREPVSLAGFRRRIGLERPAARRKPHSGVGTPALFIITITLITFMVLLYQVATGIMETLSNLIP